MDPNLNPKFEKIIKGQASYQSTNLGCNLLISRMKKNYSSQPTQVQMGSCLQEMNIFFDKYSSILTKDIELINKL